MSENEKPKWEAVDASGHLFRLDDGERWHFRAYHNDGSCSTLVAAYCVPKLAPAQVVGRAALERAAMATGHCSPFEWQQLPTKAPDQYGPSRTFWLEQARVTLRAAGVTVDEAQP